ncbi:MAG: GNAT family N-acetyltransferase [Phycisphaerae bacterium]|nr:GNAT family N-acetyltransferase [Phycisphaerae bacterium]
MERAVHDLIDRCYRPYGLRLNLADECEAHLADPGAYFRARGGEFWILTDPDSNLVATAALDLHDGPPPRLAELKSMYVDPGYRRRGIGRAMTIHVMEAARSRACAQMELWSDTRFEAAHAMYESLGFVRFGERAVADSNQSREFGFRRSL